MQDYHNFQNEKKNKQNKINSIQIRYDNVYQIQMHPSDWFWVKWK